jgi:hypothetical protein
LQNALSEMRFHNLRKISRIPLLCTHAVMPSREIDTPGDDGGRKKARAAEAVRAFLCLSGGRAGRPLPVSWPD